MRTSSLSLLSVLLLTAAGCAGGVQTGFETAAGKPVAASVLSGKLKIEGVTADGWAIVSDVSANAVEAINLTTKTVQTISSTPLVGSIRIGGGTVLVFHEKSAMQPNTAQLTAWSAATGAKTLSTSAYFVQFGPASVSGDGQTIAYFTRVNASTDALVVDTPAHNAPKTLQTIASGSNMTACNNRVQLVGRPAAYAVAYFCPVPAPGAALDTQVVSYNLVPGNGTSTVLQATSAARGFRVAPSGLRVMVKTRSQSATLISLDGSDREPVATDGVADSVDDGTWFNDSVEFTYDTTDGSLRRICSSGAPTVIQQTGVIGVLALAPDSSLIAFATGTPNDGTTTDIRVASVLSQNAPVALNVDGHAIFDTFTADGKALFYSGVDSNGVAGTFTIMPAFGGIATFPGSGLSRTNSDWELPDNRVIFNDSYAASPETVSWRLLSPGGTAPASIVDKADAASAVTPDGKTFLYTLSNDPTPANDGLWAYSL